MKVAIFVQGNIKEKYDYIIAVEAGAIILDGHYDVVISDFDSISEVEKNSLDTEKTVMLDIKKDNTDVEAAIKHAIEKGATSIDIYLPQNADRIDHLFTNILLVHKYNVRLIFNNTIIYKTKDTHINFGNYFSIYNFEKTKIKIEGALFNINEEIEPFDTKYISNEIVQNCRVTSEKPVIIVVIN